MNRIELDDTKRKIELEKRILELKEKYPEVKEFDSEKLQAVLTGKISTEYDEQLSLEDWEYFDFACMLPIEEIMEALNDYDNSSPKLDELKFINSLAVKYNVSKYEIIRRIRDIRKINKFINESSKQKFDILAVPCAKAFVVSREKSEELKNSTASKSSNERISQFDKIFRKNNLIDEGPIKKLSKKKL
ncbi:MAG: hypothetical protein IJY25_06225 [Bacilli bacterium]|nr:hypothetical protein [Bacilli bacterium]